MCRQVLSVSWLNDNSIQPTQLKSAVTGEIRATPNSLKVITGWFYHNSRLHIILNTFSIISTWLKFLHQESEDFISCV